MLKSFDLWRSYANSIFITVVGTLINMLITTMAAYVLSKKDLKGQRFFMFLAVFTMMFTGGIIPTYIVVKDLHLMNSLWAMILPSAGQHLQSDYFKKLLLGASDGAGGSGAFGRMYGDRRIV